MSCSSLQGFQPVSFVYMGVMLPQSSPSSTSWHQAVNYENGTVSWTIVLFLHFTSHWKRLMQINTSQLSYQRFSKIFCMDVCKHRFLGSFPGTSG